MPAPGLSSWAGLQRLPLLLLLWSGLLSAAAAESKSREQDQIRLALQAGQISESAKLLKSELQRQPQDVNLRLLEGLLQAQSGQKDKAIETFKKLAADHPTLPEPHNNLGVLYAERNELKLAKAAFEKALATIPSYAASHKNLMDLNARLARQAYARALRQEDGAAPMTSASLLMLPVVGGAPLPDSSAAQAVPALSDTQGTKGPGTSSTVPASPAPAVTAAVAPPSAAKIPVPVPPAPAVKATEIATAKKLDPTASPAAPAAAKPVVSAEGTAGLEKAVKDWANAWSKKDVAQYLAAYSANFEPSNRQSRQTWARDRRVRIEQRKFIRVGVSKLQIEVKGQQAQVKLEQSYESDGLNTTSRKTLDLVNEGGRWLILREKVS